jgi:hypothetical protein
MEIELLARDDDHVAARLAGLSDTPVGFRGPQIGGGAIGDALLATMLLPAMHHGGTLRVPGPLSNRLLERSAEIQQVFLTWDRLDWHTGLEPVRVELSVAPHHRASDRRVGCFFSGGVDSFYSVLRCGNEVTDVVFVHGLDVPLDAPELRDRVAMAIRAAAEAMGKRVIEIETDVRRFSDPIVDWTRYHGSLLAGVGHLLSASFRKVYIPASDTFATLSPFGSHPLLDPLWTTEDLQIVHHGLEATRADKVAFIADHDVLQWLRVCPKLPRHSLNCGTCHKCLRTMAVLRLEGLLERCSFDAEFDPRAFAALGPPTPGSRGLWQEYSQRLQASRRDPALARAVRSLLAPWRQHVQIERLRLRRLRDRFRREG